MGIAFDRDLGTTDASSKATMKWNTDRNGLKEQFVMYVLFAKIKESKLQYKLLKRKFSNYSKYNIYRQRS